MRLKLIRKRFTETATVGNLYQMMDREDLSIFSDKVPMEFVCNTLEPHAIDWENEEKVMGRTAIPEGEYVIRQHWSNKFARWMPYLLNVPHFTGIMIHQGNTVADTAGCILVGRETGGDTLINSRAAMNVLLNLLSQSDDINTIEVVSLTDEKEIRKTNRKVITNYKKYATI